MNKILMALMILACGLFWSCGDSHIAKESEFYKPFVLVVPEKYMGNLEGLTWMNVIYGEQEQTVKIYLGIINGENKYFGEDAAQHVKSVLWKIGDDTYNLPSFRYSFKEPGHKSGSLRIIDFWDDTVHKEFDFYINEPSKISIDYPYDGYNQANPLNNEALPLRWTISGIDEWESANCEVFAYYNKDSLWDYPIASVDCNNEVSLYGDLIRKEDLDKIQDSSFTIYWAVKATIYSDYAETAYDSTEIVKFSTKIYDSLSAVKIPITYSRYGGNEFPQTEIYIIATNGDTLTKASSAFSSDLINAKISPQSGVKVLVRSLNRIDYAPESLMVDIPENTVVELDTIRLYDRIKPQIAPKQSAFGKNEKIKFNLYDDGAGIRQGTLHTVINQDSISYNYSNSVIEFYSNCVLNCKLRFYGEDYANNSLPKVHWTLDRYNDSIYVKGPFTSEDD